MQQISTNELLVKHLYNETNANELKLVETALANDENLRNEFAQMQETKNDLDDIGGNEPNQSVIDKILQYSKKNAAELV